MSSSPIPLTHLRALAERTALGNSALSVTQFERASNYEREGRRRVSDCCTPNGYMPRMNAGIPSCTNPLTSCACIPDRIIPSPRTNFRASRSR